MEFLDFKVYSLTDYFSKQPGHPSCCLHCDSPLSRQNIEPSRSVQDDLADFAHLYTTHDFTLLYYCENCHWWCVRESFSWNEYNREYDFVIVGVASEGASGVADEKPWLKPMSDSRIYEYAGLIPGKIAKIFP